MNKEKVFGEGIYFDRPNPNAPEFIKGKIGIKAAPFIEFLNKHVNVSGYVNLTLKEAKTGKLYFELDTWTKTITDAKVEANKAGEATKEAVLEDKPPF